MGQATIEEYHAQFARVLAHYDSLDAPVERMNVNMMARGEPLKAMRPMMMAKLYSTDTMQRIVRCAYDLLGADGVLAPAPEDVAGWARNATATGWVEAYIFSLGPAIAGGASNIQLNIIFMCSM